MIALLAQQNMPPTDSVESLLAWVCGGLLLALLGLVSFVVKQQSDHKVELATVRAEHREELIQLNGKVESNQERMLNLALRVQRGLEVIAGIDEAEIMNVDEE